MRRKTLKDISALAIAVNGQRNERACIRTSNCGKLSLNSLLTLNWRYLMGLLLAVDDIFLGRCGVEHSLSDP